MNLGLSADYAKLQVVRNTDPKSAIMLRLQFFHKRIFIWTCEVVDR
jgi:hypothetical protein